MPGSKAYLPQRGDIVLCNFNPVAGHEQAHHRPALVLSPHVFQEKTGMAVMAPITNTKRGHGMEVDIEDGDTTGVALIHQIRSIDFEARQVTFREHATQAVVAEACQKAGLLFK